MMYIPHDHGVGGQGAPGSLFTRIINFNDLPDWEKVSFVDRVSCEWTTTAVKGIWYTEFTGEN